MGSSGLTKDVLLVFPGMYGAFKPELPLNLLYLSDALMRAGHSCRVLDIRLEKYDDLSLGQFSCVGISTMSGPMIKYAIEFAKYVKKTDPDLPVIWGGVHPTLLPEQTISSPLCDVVVHGEGEQTMVELVDSLQNGKPLDSVKGITYKRNGEVRSTPERDFYDLNAVPMELPYELFDLEAYGVLKPTDPKEPYSYGFPLHSSRGCPHRCGFCYITALKKWGIVFRRKTPQRVVDEIEYVVNRFNVKEIHFFYEDEFFVLTNRVEEIVKELIDRKIDVLWSSFCRYDDFRKQQRGRDFIRLLERGGCKHLSFGAESGSQRILDLIKKDIKVEDILNVTKLMTESDIIQVTSFMTGLPTETKDDLRMTFDLIDQLRQINPQLMINGLFFFTPYPGTELYDMVVNQYGFQVPQALEQWGEYKPYRVQGCTWLDPRMERILKGVSIMSRFPFYTDQPVVPLRFREDPKLYLAYRFLAASARFRWKRRFFDFPFEWNFVESQLERMRGFV